MSTAFTKVKTVALRPMPSPSASTATSVNHLSFNSIRTAKRRSLASIRAYTRRGSMGFVSRRDKFEVPIHHPSGEATSSVLAAVAPVIRTHTRFRRPRRARLRSTFSRAKQGQLPRCALADLDLCLLHRAGSVDVRPLRAGFRPPDGRLADAGPGRYRHRRVARTAARRRARPVHSAFHRGSPEPSVSQGLLHAGV